MRSTTASGSIQRSDTGALPSSNRNTPGESQRLPVKNGQAAPPQMRFVVKSENRAFGELRLWRFPEQLKYLVVELDSIAHSVHCQFAIFVHFLRWIHAMASRSTGDVV